MKWCLIVLITLGVAKADNAVHSVEYSSFTCPELNSQDKIDLDEIMGKWYVVEIFEHKIDPMKMMMSGTHVVIDTCPIVKLRPHEISALKLLWTEEAGNLEYTFRIPDISRRRGLWLTMSVQNGTLAKKQYSQFVGNVHVMKAVASDMVLTFCSRGPNSQLYSLLLSREHTLDKSNKNGVHKLLERRGLKIISTRETCVHGGASHRRGSFEMVSWTTLMGLLSTSILLKSWQ